MTRRGLCATAGMVTAGLALPAWGMSLRADGRMAYGPDPRQTLRLYPARGQGPHPLVIMVGDATERPSGAMERAARHLASRGMTVALTDRRPSRHGLQAHTSDVVRALSHLLSQADGLSLDGRFALWGEAGGASAVLLVARDRRYLTAAKIDPYRLWGTVALGAPPETDPTFTRASAYGLGPTRSLYQGQAGQAAQGTAFLDGLF